MQEVMKETVGQVRKPRSYLLTARETVDYLNISLSTLNRMEKQGLLIPFRTPGGHRRYDKAMLDEYLETTRRGPRRQSNDGDSTVASQAAPEFAAHERRRTVAR